MSYPRSLHLLTFFDFLYGSIYIVNDGALAGVELATMQSLQSRLANLSTIPLSFAGAKFRRGTLIIIMEIQIHSPLPPYRLRASRSTVTAVIVIDIFIHQKFRKPAIYNKTNFYFGLL